MYQLSDTKAQDALRRPPSGESRSGCWLDSDPSGGGSSTMNQAAYSDLSTSSVEVRWAWSGTLWHQKGISRDGAAALIMTCNLYAPYYSFVRDFAVITDNPATVAGMEATFDKDWQATAARRLPAWCPAARTWSGHPALRRRWSTYRLGALRTTIWAEDEQLDSPPIQQALVSAVKRGVTVNFLIPSRLTGRAGWPPSARAACTCAVPAQRPDLHPREGTHGQRRHGL